MSEFKYACPVCGQHISCDSSQAGTVMECPTCFQKITVPQAPVSGDQKFILTGSQVTQKRVATLADTGSGTAPKKKFPMVFLVLVLVCVAGAGVYFFGAKILHSSWETRDIGNVGAPGSFSQAKDTLTITGSGADIWGQADAFRYVYRALSGDVILTARVVKMQDTDPWAKAGLMIRKSLTPGSACAQVLVTPGSGVVFQQRNSASDRTSSTPNPPHLHAPCWLRLMRLGNTFIAEASTNGTFWRPIASTTIGMGKPIYAGLAVSSHHDGTLCQAVFDHVTVEAVNPAAGEVARNLIAPQANDTNWSLTPDLNAIPNYLVTGQIHGKNFIAEQAYFQNGTLTLHNGRRGPLELSVAINFEHLRPRALSRKTINISTNAEKAARVTLRWVSNSGTAKASFDSNYALRLKFNALAGNRLPGKIYLCLPDDEKSYVLGTFNAEVRKSRPPKK